MVVTMRLASRRITSSASLALRAMSRCRCVNCVRPLQSSLSSVLATILRRMACTCAPQKL